MLIKMVTVNLATLQICDCPINGSTALAAHIKGRRHLKVFCFLFNNYIALKLDYAEQNLNILQVSHLLGFQNTSCFFHYLR